MTTLSQQLTTFESQGVSFWDLLSGGAARKQLTGEQIMALLLSGIYDQLTGNTSQIPAALPQPYGQNISSESEVVELFGLAMVPVIVGSNFGSFKAPFNGTAIMAITSSVDCVLSVTMQTIGGTNVNTTPAMLDGQAIIANQLKFITIPINYGVKYSFSSDFAGEMTVQITGAPVLIQIQNPTVAIASNQTVDIGNSPVVQIANNQSVEIAGTPTVDATITGPVTIQTSSGPIEATITGTVSIAANQVVEVQNTSGGSVTVAGSVNIGNTPAVTISGTPTVEISGTPTIDIGNTPAVTVTSGTITAEFASAQDVTISSTAPVEVQNIVLSDSSMVYLGTGTTTISNLVNNAEVGVPLNNAFAANDVIIADGILIAIYSAGSKLYALNADTYLYLGIADGYSGDIRYSPVYSPFPNVTALTWNGHRGVSPLTLFPVPISLNQVLVRLLNNTGSTIVSDTVQVFAWAVKAQISNPVSNPAQTQSAIGSFDNYIPVDTGLTLNANTTILSSGNYIKQIRLSLYLTFSASITYYIYVNNGVPGSAFTMYELSGTGSSVSAQIDFTFPNGVYNNGLFVTLDGTGGTLTYSLLQGLLLTSSSTPNARTSTIV